MKDMKLHEGAGLSAAFGGMHERRDVTNERRTGHVILACVRS